MNAIIIRKKENGRYEMISGHRRLLACKKLGLEKIPSIIKNLNDEEATIYMVDSNFFRKKLFPSEKGFAYKMKMEALKKLRKSDVNQLNTEVCQVGTVVRSDNLLASEIGESARNIQRYIRLTNLIPELLQLVDNTELKLSPAISLTPAVELSYLKKDEQKLLFNYIDRNLTTPSHSQAIKLRDLSMKNLLVGETMDNILNKAKPNQISRFKIQEEKLLQVIPKNIKRENIEEFVLKACEYYTKHLRQRDRER